MGTLRKVQHIPELQSSRLSLFVHLPRQQSTPKMFLDNNDGQEQNKENEKSVTV